jgi:hypothetical protein
VFTLSLDVHRNVQLGGAKKSTTDGEVVKLRETVDQLSQELSVLKVRRPYNALF